MHTYNTVAAFKSIPSFPDMYMMSLQTLIPNRLLQVNGEKAKTIGGCKIKLYWMTVHFLVCLSMDTVICIYKLTLNDNVVP